MANAMKCIDGPYFPVVQILQFPFAANDRNVVAQGDKLNQFACDTRQNPVCGRGAAQGIVFPPQNVCGQSFQNISFGSRQDAFFGSFLQKDPAYCSHSVQIGTFVPWLFAKVGDVAVNQPDS